MMTSTVLSGGARWRPLMRAFLSAVAWRAVATAWCGADIAPPACVAYAPGKADVAVLRDGTDFLRFGTAVWGPNWSYTDVKGSTRAENGAALGSLSSGIGGETLRLEFSAQRSATNALSLRYELRAERETRLTLFAVQVTPGAALDGRDLLVESGGKQRTLRGQLGRRPVGEQVTALSWTDGGGGRTRLRFDPPCDIAADGALRLVLAQDMITADAPRRLNVTVELPGATAWYAGPADVPDEHGLDAWYPWQGADGAADGALDMSGWTDGPAGRHGRIRSRGAQLIYNGKPIRLWGLNLCYGACAPDKETADRRAAFYPRYGFNAVRLHKFADGAGWNGIQSKESAADYDPAGLDRMDYQVARFKEAGVFVKLSAHFGTVSIGPADRRDVPHMDELGRVDPRANRVTAPHSAFFYSPELQDLQIRQIVNLLGHRNPHTGMMYAEDPAVCAVEIINEQSILFFTSMAPLKQSETLRRRTGERFSAWLASRYGDHAGLVKAWGARALDAFASEGFPAGEQLDRRNVLPLGNPWYWDPAQLEGTQAHLERRLLDTLRFLYELQCEAYDRYVAAVRKAGYDGEILGSNWQAGRAFSHYANLHTDARVGLIDRHNYFGGNQGGVGPFASASMLARAGSGTLSSGLQQVNDRPFMVSEWIHVFPNEWGAEGPAIIGAYGMGLQGWDASFLFQNEDHAAFSRSLGGSAWDVMAPQILGLMPAVARQVRRGDVRESEVVAARHVHMPSLFEGRLGFEDTVAQGYDDKELDSRTVPARALAAARCAVTFGDAYRETPAFDLRPYIEDGCVVSSTKQLRWGDGAGRTSGWFTMNTEGTKAVVGFAEGRECPLGGVTIRPRSRFAAIYVSAPGKSDTVAASPRLLVTAMARARNTGMKFGPGGAELLDKGRAPILMEPVKAEIAFAGRRVKEVRLLDHDGRRTERTVPVNDSRFVVDGARDRTPYYEVMLEDNAAAKSK